MSSGYPYAIDDIPADKTNETVLEDDHPGHHNLLAEAITNAQVELGIDPSGSFASVRDRLESVEYATKVAAGYDFVIGAADTSSDLWPICHEVCAGDGTDGDVFAAALAELPSRGGSILALIGKYVIGDTVPCVGDGHVIDGVAPGYPTGTSPLGRRFDPTGLGAVQLDALQQLRRPGISLMDIVALESVLPLRTGTIFSAHPDFGLGPDSFLFDLRPEGNLYTSLDGALASGATSAKLKSVAGLPASGTVRIQGAVTGTGYAATYTSIDGPTKTLLGLAPVLPFTTIPPANDGARVSYGDDNLGANKLRHCSLDGYGPGNPFANGSGVYFQVFAGELEDVYITRFRYDLLVVDGGGTAVFPHGAWDNRFERVRLRICGRDCLQLLYGGTDNQLDHLIAAAWGRYGCNMLSGSGAQFVAGHWYAAKTQIVSGLGYTQGAAVHGDARQLKFTGGRITNVGAGGLDITGLTAQGAGLNVTGMSMRDVSGQGRGLSDYIRIAPDTPIGGVNIMGLDVGSYDDDLAARNIVRLENANIADVNIGPIAKTVTTGGDVICTEEEIYAHQDVSGLCILSGSRPRVQALSDTFGTVTVTIASPAVLTKTAHGLKPGDQIRFTTTGALPTGLTALTTYYVLAETLVTTKATVDDGSVLTGTGAFTAGSTALVGTGSLFLTELQVGDSVMIGGRSYTLAAIADNTHATLTSAADDTASGQLVVRDVVFAATAGWPSTGSFVLTGYPVGYTGALADRFTGCSGIKAAAAGATLTLNAGTLPDTFRLSATDGGAPIATSGTQSGTHSLRRNIQPRAQLYTAGTVLDLAADALIANPRQTSPNSNQTYLLKIKTTSVRALSYGSAYRDSASVPLPTVTTGGGAWDVLQFAYSAEDHVWDLLGVNLGLS